MGGYFVGDVGGGYGEGVGFLEGWVVGPGPVG